MSKSTRFVFLRENIAKLDVKNDMISKCVSGKILWNLQYAFLLFVCYIIFCHEYNTIRVANGLGPDKAWRLVGPDLGSNCLKGLST